MQVWLAPGEEKIVDTQTTPNLSFKTNSINNLFDILAISYRFSIYNLRNSGNPFRILLWTSAKWNDDLKARPYITSSRSCWSKLLLIFWSSNLNYSFQSQKPPPVSLVYMLTTADIEYSTFVHTSVPRQKEIADRSGGIEIIHDDDDV